MKRADQPSRITRHSVVAALFVLAAVLKPPVVAAQTAAAIEHAVLSESAQRTAEVSTSEVRRFLAERSATILDARPVLELRFEFSSGLTR